MTSKKDNRDNGFGSAVLGVLFVGTIVVFLILTLVLLERNGTLSRIKRQFAAWKLSWEEAHKKPEEPLAEPDGTLTHFGPTDGKTYEFWELFSWVPKEEQPEPMPTPVGGHREPSQNPVNGSEAWWKEMTRLSEVVTVYAQQDTPLFGAPDAKTEVFGYTFAGEEFRLYAVSEDGWYVVTDGDFYYCSEGTRFTMTVPEPVDFSGFEAYVPVKHPLKGILQNPELPHGCEVTALAMLLSYYGVKAEKCELSDNWLPKGIWGATDFRKAFVGNPRNKLRSAGCYAGVIAATAENYLAAQKQELTVEYAEGLPFSGLIEKLREAPVLVWTTMKLKPSYIAQVWQVDGKELLWQNCEHCVVLTGYDFEKGVFYGEDPLYGTCEYEMQLFYLRYVTMFSQAVWIR